MDFDFGTVCFHPLQKIFNLRKQPDFILNEAFQKTHSKCDNMAFVQTDRINVY